MKRAPPAPDLGRPAIHIHAIADINRVIFHLFTRWTLPRVEIHIDSLPPLFIQLTQHRMARIAEAPLGGLAVSLAAVVFLVGVLMAWASVRSMVWTAGQTLEYLTLAAIAALYAGLLGLVVGAIRRRVRLLLVLRDLRRRMLAGSSTIPAQYAGRVDRHVAAKRPASPEIEIDEGDGRRAKRRDRPRRSSLVVRHRSDINRLVVHLLTHWRLPRVRISVDGVAPLEVQRAQHRIALLFESCSCVLAVSLAGATILIGAFTVKWISAHNWKWWIPQSLGALGLIPLAALGAAIMGALLEMAWDRVRLLLAVRGVRHRLAG